MKLKLNTILAAIAAGLLLPADGLHAQISISQDHKNYTSAPIGTFQGINFREGGFSGAYYVPNTNGREFWVCSDRGVNIDAANANPSGCAPTYDKIYSFPSYAPKIHRVRLNGDSVQILQTISIKRPGGTTATGIINPTGFGSTATEVASTDTVQNCLNFAAKTTAKDIWGIDCEGIAVDASGNFWLCEEGGPTVWKLDQNGVVLKRYTPYAGQVGAQSIDVQIDTCFKYRKNNRGFEGITIAPNGKIYAIIQSPLLYPTKTVGENSRVHRILEIDPVTNATRMFVYLNDGIIGASGSNQIRLRDWKIGDMAAINDTTFLVIEAALRGTTDVKRVYKINISAASVVTSALYGGSTLEALVDSAGLAANGIVPVKKTLFMDINAIGWDPSLDKTECLAIVNDSTIVIGNDNDYGQFSPLENGIATATGNLSHMLTYRLQGANKLSSLVVPSIALSMGITGPSTAGTPYIVPAAPGVSLTSMLTVGDAVGGYRLCGLVDGTGAFDNGDGTFTVVIGHEINNSSGVNRAHGQKGAFVSKWVVRKSDLAVLSGSDMIQNVNLWNPVTSSYITYNSAFTSPLAAMSRFCSADLPEVSAFYNAATGKGTMERIFMNGEESGSEGRAFGHIITGAAAGTTYELPRLGKFSWENSVASPLASDTTVVIGTDDATPGQVYVYVGTKTTTGTDVEKAGLTNGRLYGVAVAGMTAESSASVPAAGTTFALADLGNVQNMTGVAINNASNSAGVTNFLRPEDCAWDPQNPNDFYFVTTNSFSSPSRLWRLRFNDARKPMLGGTITAMLDGSEGQKMLDNMTIDNYGHIFMQEDVGNNGHLGKTWQYTIATGNLKMIASHDSTRFLAGGSGYLTQDEEASGIIDMEKILGPGNFFIVDQAHYFIPGELVDGGQMLMMFNPDTYNSAPEADLTGNSVAIADGDNSPSAADNTHFGNVYTGANTVKSFVINNTGAGALTVNSLAITGANSADFAFISAPATPFTLAAGGTQTINVRFTPSAAGSRVASLEIGNNDITEAMYNVAIAGMGVDSPEVNVAGAGIAIIDGDMTPGTANNTDFGTVLVGSTMANTFVISNSGYGNMVVSGVNFTGAAAADFSLSGAPVFPLTIAAGSSYTLTAAFAPVAGGVRNATMNILTNDADEATFDFAVRGTGQYLPEINVKGNGISIIDGDITAGSANNTDFWSVNTGSSNTRNFVVQNTGLGTLSVTGVTFTGSSSAEFALVSAPSFPLSIAPGDSQTVTVRFSPSAGGARPATMNILSNDADESTYNFAIQGTGVAMPEINVKGNGVNIVDGDVTAGVSNNTDFGSLNLGANAIRTFVIQNNGVGALNITSIGFAGAAEFTIVGSPSMPASIAPNDSVIISVQFAATTVGIRTAVINIYSNDADEATYNFLLQGTTLGVPEINVKGNGVDIADGDATPGVANFTDFGPVNLDNYIQKSFIIENKGLGILNISDINFTGANAADFTLYGAPSFPVSVAAGGSQAFVVQFKPSGAGVRTGKITIVNTDNDEANYDFAVAGTGVATTGVGDLASAMSMKVFPNPAGNSAMISLSLREKATISVSVTDISGRVVAPTIEKAMNAGDQTIELNTAGLNDGIYFLRITDGTSTSNVKLVVMH
ncbi:MAG: choice-of-anchor D domain-containing protein [Flavipsychrobacter sp.]|nr:choice-of-anchor D domain-containing protein [Flavipsychrobacter sp.]